MQKKTVRCFSARFFCDFCDRLLLGFHLEIHIFYDKLQEKSSCMFNRRGNRIENDIGDHTQILLLDKCSKQKRGEFLLATDQKYFEGRR